MLYQRLQEIFRKKIKILTNWKVKNMYKINCLTIALTLLSGCSSTNEKIMQQANGHAESELTHASEDSLVINGLGNLQDKNLHSLVINGSGSLNNIHAENVTIHGTLVAEKTKINNLQVNGKALLKNCTISGKTIINGLLEAEHASLADVYLNTNFSQFTHSKISHIFVKAPKIKTQQTIELIDSEISGTIEFEQLGGEVRIVGMSKVVGGVIKGNIRPVKQ
jgi:hypothetical protein